MTTRCQSQRGDVFSTPKFFKVIVDPTPHNLRIPPEFMKRHGRNLGNRVFLKVPRTTFSWEVELVIQSSNGETVLQKGWKEFAQRYSLSFGHFLVFEYNGNSQFNVLIFDRSATETDYPDFEAEPSGTESDDSIEVLEHLSSTKPKFVPDSGTHVLQSKKKRKKSSFTGRVEKETFMAYQRAIDFAAGSTFRNPFFISIMHPSYIVSAESGLEIPQPFVKENMSSYKSSSVSLGIKNDKKKMWPIKLYRYINRAKLSSGWKYFVKDNGLKIGDACIFEVCNDFHWNVVIFKS